MILPINSAKKVYFSGKKQEQSAPVEQKEEKGKKLPYSKDTLLKNNFLTRTRIGFDKFTNAMTLYPAKGIKGSRNSNFYEFLTMGSVPYIIGSLMLMSVFNSANKHFDVFSKSKAGPIGRKMALGVLFYGVAKQISKSFISAPVKTLTGVDLNIPYAKFVNEDPEYPNDSDITSIEYHKVYESVDFPYWQMLYNENNGKPRNEYFDKISKKLGMGSNLNDSDQEVKPLIKEILIKAKTATNLSSYLWAATGVALAFQEPWEDFFNVMSFKFWDKAKITKSAVAFKDSLISSAKAFYHGEGKGLQKHAGKILLGAAIASSVLGVANVMNISGKPSKLSAGDVIDNKEKYVVN